LKVLKGKPNKFRWIMTHVKFFKNMLLGQRNWKQTKIVTHMDLWKYGQILTMQKSLTIKQLRFSNKRFFIWIFHLILHHILNFNNKFGMWINIRNFIFLMVQLDNQSIFFNFKVHYYKQMNFLSINNHIVLFIMKFLV